MAVFVLTPVWCGRCLVLDPPAAAGSSLALAAGLLCWARASARQAIGVYDLSQSQTDTGREIPQNLANPAKTLQISIGNEK